MSLINNDPHLIVPLLHTRYAAHTVNLQVSVLSRSLHYDKVLISLSSSFSYLQQLNGFPVRSLTFALPSQLASSDLSGQPRLQMHEEGEPGMGAKRVTMATPLHHALSLSVVMELIGDGDGDSCYAPSVSEICTQLQRVRDQIAEQYVLFFLPF